MLLKLAIALNLDGLLVVLTAPFTYRNWPPPHELFTLDVILSGLACVVLACAAIVVSLQAIKQFYRSYGARRFCVVFPVLTCLVAMLCLFVVLDYPSAQKRFVQETSERLNAEAKRIQAEMQEEHQQ